MTAHSTGIRAYGPGLDWALWRMGTLYYWVEPEADILPQLTGAGMTAADAARFAWGCGATHQHDPNKDGRTHTAAPQTGQYVPQAPTP